MKNYQKIMILGALIALSGCATQDGPPNFHKDIANIPNATPKIEPQSRIGNKPYTVNGTTYYPLKSSRGYDVKGIASWYGMKFHNRYTSGGERYDLFGMTAAHRTLPIPTYVRVTNLENGKRVIVKVNDRGPFEKNRLIDLSYVAAAKLGILAKGTGLVEVTAINPAQYKTTSIKPVKVSSKTQPEIYLQLGAFGKKDYAIDMQKRVKKVTTVPCIIVTTNQKINALYRVQVGPIQTVEASDKLAAQLKKAGLPESYAIVKSELTSAKKESKPAQKTQKKRVKR